MDTCLHRVFEAQARRFPDRIAVTDGMVELTYRDLERRALGLARRVRAAGTSPGDLVGLFVDRRVEMVVGLLGILMAGCAYVPIDPGYPRSRIDLILDDTGIRTAVTVADLSDQLAGHADVVVVDDPEPQGDTAARTAPAGDAVAVAGSDLAYVIYTSGSTGRPKGVLIEHGSVVRLFDATHGWFGFDENDVWTLFHSVSFDFSVWEIWGALLHGGRLVIVPGDVVRTPDAFLRLLAEQQVTVLNQTPTAFRQLIAARQVLPELDLPLRLVILGGERLDVASVASWLDHYGDETPQLVNMYGITETTVHVTYRRLRRADTSERERSPIGVSIPDLRVRLVDEHLDVVGPGACGEILVSGPGLARGYLNRPELTAERFVTLMSDGEPVRCYRSGDLAMRTLDGELLYLGRADEQLKVRGYRVEPAEVEICVASTPGVAAAVVMSRDFGGGDVRLVAFVVPRSGAPGDSLARAVAATAAGALPAHMRPSHVVVVTEIPLTAHGKIDREALWAGADATAVSSMGAAPRGAAPMGAAQDGDTWVSDVEREVAELSRSIVQTQDLGRDDDLFEAGATSLSFTLLLAQVNLRFGVEVTGRHLNGEATIARVAYTVERLISQHEPVDSQR